MGQTEPRNKRRAIYKEGSEVKATLSCLTLFDSMDCSPPGSSIHGISQARILECVAILEKVEGTQMLNPQGEANKTD